MYDRTSASPGACAQYPATASATTALSAIQPKCRPRVARALASAANANTQARVTTIQCRAGSDAIQGAAISSTPPPIQATVPACHTSRIRVRSRAGSMVARAKHFGFAEHAVDQGGRDRGQPRTLQQEIAHRTGLHTVLYGYSGRWRLSIQWCMVDVAGTT